MCDEVWSTSDVRGERLISLLLLKIHLFVFHSTYVNHDKEKNNQNEKGGVWSEKADILFESLPSLAGGVACRISTNTFWAAKFWCADCEKLLTDWCPFFLAWVAFRIFLRKNEWGVKVVPMCKTWHCNLYDIRVNLYNNRLKKQRRIREKTNLKL